MARVTKFRAGDIVQFGNGKVPYRAMAVITTGRITTYDLKGDRRYIGIPESRLSRYKGPTGRLY